MHNSPANLDGMFQKDSSRFFDWLHKLIFHLHYRVTIYSTIKLHNTESPTSADALAREPRFLNSFTIFLHLKSLLSSSLSSIYHLSIYLFSLSPVFSFSFVCVCVCMHVHVCTLAVFSQSIILFVF